MENKTFLELAAETLGNGDVVLGAKYLLKAYYESNKSKEILGYFDEIFFKPNLEELERIYNLNVDKIKIELKRETLEFKDLAYYVIPIEENHIYVYDKKNNDIISENFTKEQVNIIELCTNEDLSIEEDIRGYLNILLKNENANSILKFNQIKNMNPSEVFKIAEEHLAKGNDEEAELYYKDLLESKDFASLACFRLGEIKNRQKDIKNSYDYHMKAFSVNPNLAMSITNKEHPHNNYTYKKIEEVMVVNCPICGGVSDMHSCYNMITNIDFIEGFNPIRLWLYCQECNHIFANSYPKNLEYLLKNTAPPYHLNPNVNYLPIIHDILIDVKKQAKGNRFLEIGVGSGEMTAVAKELLFDITGVEIRKAYAEKVAQRLDVPVYAENVMSFNTKTPFDVICMGDVIEHLIEPKELIAHIVSLLNEDGVFWLSTPNFQSAFSLTVKDKDPMWRVCEHINYFSFDSIKKLLAIYNLEVINYKPSKHYNGSMEIISRKSPEFNNKPGTIKFSSKKLHVGCGRNILEGWINLDLMPLSGVDVVADLDDCKNKPLPLPDNSIEEFYVSHVIEHINNPLPMMQELHRVALPNAKAVFRCPYGSTDEAFEDPTHVKQYFLNSFGYFSQPFYWRADYGYRGDWLTEKIVLVVDKNRHKGKSPQKIFEEINLYRNVVKEMIVELRAVKPIRDTNRELQVQPEIEISLA